MTKHHDCEGTADWFSLLLQFETSERHLHSLFWLQQEKLIRISSFSGPTKHSQILAMVYTDLVAHIALPETEETRTLCCQRPKRATCCPPASYCSKDASRTSDREVLTPTVTIILYHALLFPCTTKFPLKKK